MKKFYSVLALLFFGLGYGQITNNLLLEYKCNGNADDSSGNNYNATVHGATLAPDRNGNPNSAYYFDGVDDYIEFPNLAALKPQLPVSFAFWVRYDSTDWQDQTVFSTSEEDDRAAGIWFNSTASGAKFAVNYGDGSQSYTSGTRRTFVADTVIDTNNWYHLVVVVKGPTDMHIYVNCDEFQGNYSGSGGPLVYSTFPGVIGRHDRSIGGPPDFFKGYIDDFRYWDREVLPEEVFGLCQTVPPPVFAINQGCAGDAYLLTAVPDQTVPPGTVYSWTGPNNFTASGNPIDITGLPIGTYTVTATLPGNIVVTQSVQVTSNTFCNIPSFTITQGCVGADYVLTVVPNPSVPPQMVFSWTGPADFSATGDSIIITGLPAGDYVLTVDLGNGFSVTQSVAVANTICAFPSFTISQGCVDAAYLLNVVPNQSFPDGTVYSWTGPNNFTASGNPIDITGLPIGTYTVTATLPGNIVVTESVQVTSNTFCNIPSFTITQGCVGADYVLTVVPAPSVPPQMVFSWTGPADFSATGDSIIITGLPAGNYVLTVDLGNGFSVTQSVAVANTTCALPLFTISQGCFDEKYLLTATPVAPDTSVSTYTWTGPDSFFAIGNPVDITGLATGTYAVAASLPDNLTVTQSVTVAATSCRIPKGISPDDDQNNTFDLSGFDVKWVKIFNRYGMKVYEMDGYVNQWRGQDDSGHELPGATYYYQVQLASGEIRTGWVYLLRRK
ncbi:hypothetical protein FLLO111716_08090 [Flavobacterium longum]|uniref:LamG-like jellyroll fold domain-containing protein n=1 Tax=Flavobacterium longum TaxID=1299340 RepID=UPI0039E8FE1F